MIRKAIFMQTITVPLGERSYPIHIERGLLAKTGEMIRENLGDIAVAVVSDDHVAPLYMEEVVSSMEKVGLRVCSIVLPHGEQTKCLKSLETLYAFLCEHHLTRKDAIVALGGGVIGDLAGLAAATYLRGVHFVQLPTTLLAQVDSSVGGKVAVDLPQGKNLVGAFYQPELVLVDPDSLRTLTDDFWRDGLGEVVKYGCIGDEALDAEFEWCDMGIASLGRHRNGITGIKTLKNREYTARGIPFVYSERDSDFDGMDYVMKAPADDTPLDIAALVRFYDGLHLTPAQIRGTVEGRLSWDNQMKQVLTELFEA